MVPVCFIKGDAAIVIRLEQQDTSKDRILPESVNDYQPLSFARG